MKVLFSASLKIELGKAKSELITAYPSINFSNAVSLLDLEKILIDNGITHYTELPEYDFSIIESRLNEIKLDNLICDDLLNDEISVPNNFSYCETPDESINIPEIDVNSIITEIENMAHNSEADIKSVLECVGKMQDIATTMSNNIAKRTDANNLLGVLEELLYNYRIFDAYHQKRLDTINSVTDTFSTLTNRVNVLQKQLDIATSDIEKNDIQQKLNTATNELFITKAGYPEFSELFNDGTNDFSEPVLLNRINSIRNGSIGMPISTFTTKAEFKADNENIINPKIRFNYVDDKGLLSGLDTSFANDLLPFPNDEVPHGILYDSLLNIIGDTNKMFTADERGLSTDRTQADPELVGAGEIDGMVVSNAEKFKAFYSDFPNRHKQRVDEKKIKIIEPALTLITNDLLNTARTEILMLLAYERVYIKPSVSNDGLINTVKNESEKALSKSTALRNCIKYLQQIIDESDKLIKKSKNDFEQVECAQKHLRNKIDSQPSTAPGSDPLGIISLNRIKADDPDSTKQCWWLVFAALATSIGVMPIPGNGGFKYWPIGLIIPSPGGPIKIPLPIIWIPLVVIPTPIGLFVLFIGQCGICPSPFLMYIGTSGEKKFLVSLRPTQDFGSGASNGPVKDITMGGIATPIPTTNLLNNYTNKVTSYLDKTKNDSLKYNDVVQKYDIPKIENKKTEIDSAFADVRKALEKIGLPNIPSIPNNATIDEKKSTVKKIVSEHLSKLKVPDIKIPKNASKVNPKLPPVTDILGEIKRLTAIKMPNIGPGSSNINITEKLYRLIDKIDTTKVDIKIPPYNPKIPSSKDPHEKAVKQWINVAIGLIVNTLTPELFGVKSKPKIDLNIFIPFICTPSIKGLDVPQSPELSAAIAIIKASLNAATQSIDIIKLNETTPITNTNVKSVLKNLIKQLPDTNIPDPINMIDMITDSCKMLAITQVPAMPDVSNPIQQQVTIPGDSIVGPLRTAVDGIISSIFSNINVRDLDIILSSPIEFKQFIISIVNQSQSSINKIMDTAITPISAYKKSSNLEFPKLLGLKPQIKPSDLSPVELTTTVNQDVLKQAKEVLKGLSIIPYPAVLLLPEVFKMMHPILSHDDLPPWERLSPNNFLFVTFLDQFCEQGKKGGGLLENP